MAHKLQVKLGSAEFCAEGEETAVKEQFSAFLAALQATPAIRQATPPDQTPPAINGTLPDPIVLDDAALRRVFAADENGSISLRILPRTERRDADALILLLFGYRTLGQSTDVGSGPLMAAARLSGLQLERIDHQLAAYRHLITEGGLRRGKRYGLNNQGINHAEQLIRGML